MLTLHQPWASLVALGVKTIETRSWSAKYRGPLAIHAGSQRPPLMHLPPYPPGRLGADEPRFMVIDTITDDAFKGLQPTGKRIPKRAQTPTLFSPHAGPHGRPHVQGTPATEQGTAVYLPLGAIVATCTLVDVVPIYRSSQWPYDLQDQPAVVLADERWPIGVYPELVAFTAETMAADEPGVDVSDQLPYGLYEPGRYAWLLADVVPVDPPVPFKGGQGLTKTWEQVPA